MQTQDYYNLIVKLLVIDATREQCNAVMECTDGDLRMHAAARLTALDANQREAQKTVYMETVPGMVDTWDIREWWIKNKGIGGIHHIDFHAIAEGKKQEWYAYVDAETSTLNQL